jgi:hypothetical protein
MVPWNRFWPFQPFFAGEECSLVFELLLVKIFEHLFAKSLLFLLLFFVIPLQLGRLGSHVGAS